MLDVTIVTGMSGAGRSSAADALEDLGFFVIDNLPPALIPKVAELGAGGGRPSRYALVVDVRSGAFVDDLDAALRELRATGARTRILFLDASDDVLVRRFEASRRRHPLSDAGSIVDGIRLERALLEELKGQADVVVDTSDLNVHELRDRMRELFGGPGPEPGDCRRTSCRSATSTACRSTSTSSSTAASCPNPHWVERLRPLPGTDPQVRALRAEPARGHGVPR